MTARAWVQQVAQHERNYLNTTRVAHWFWERGYEICRFSVEELRNGRMDDDLRFQLTDIVLFGGLGVVREALCRAGISMPKPLDIPQSIKSWAGRPIWESTLAEVRSWVEQETHRLPVHVKPRDHEKLFTGCVVNSFRDLISSSHVVGETPVLLQGVVKLRSEWRAYVLRGQIGHVGHYAGDPLCFPDPRLMIDAVSAFTERPIAFGIDWGVTDEGQTVLIEVNDGFSLGNYGAPGWLYSAMIEARWRQLVGLADNGVGFGPQPQ